MKGRIGRVPGLKTRYYTEAEVQQLKGAVAAYQILHPDRTLHSIAAFIKRWANEEDPSYRGADVD